jgi:hypothetical protein
MTTQTIPELSHRCNSWIIADNDTAVMETWDRSFVETIASRNAPGVVIYTALQWLERFNAQVSQANAI